MKKILIVVLLFLVCVSLILFLNEYKDKIPCTYNNENVLYKPGEIRCYFIPAGSYVSGHIKSKGKFSAYILTEEELKKFKNGEVFESIASWKNINFVELNMTIPNESCYLVVKNEENKSQWIKVRVKTRK